MEKRSDMSSIFTKIVRGEVPCYKIYEDERTLAFLDIAPEAPGHTLVVPKVEVEKLYELDDEDYRAVMATVKKLAKHFDAVLGERMMIKVVGVDVPHAHVHILPARAETEKGVRVEMTPEELEAMAKKLRIEENEL